MRAKTILISAALMLAGCYSPGPAKKEMAAQLAADTAFIEKGKTTREQTLLKLGIPSRQFEGGRILAWRVRTREEGLVTVSDYPGQADPRYNTWPAGTRGYDLVIVFDDRDLVQTHSLIPARP